MEVNPAFIKCECVVAMAPRGLPLRLRALPCSSLVDQMGTSEDWRLSVTSTVHSY